MNFYAIKKSQYYPTIIGYLEPDSQRGQKFLVNGFVPELCVAYPIMTICGMIQWLYIWLISS